MRGGDDRDAKLGREMALGLAAGWFERRNGQKAVRFEGTSGRGKPAFAILDRPSPARRAPDQAYQGWRQEIGEGTDLPISRMSLRARVASSTRHGAWADPRAKWGMSKAKPSLPIESPLARSRARARERRSHAEEERTPRRQVGKAFMAASG